MRCFRLTGIGRYVACTLEQVDPVETEAEEGDYHVQFACSHEIYSNNSIQGKSHGPEMTGSKY